MKETEVGLDPVKYSMRLPSGDTGLGPYRASAQHADSETERLGVPRLSRHLSITNSIVRSIRSASALS